MAGNYFDFGFHQRQALADRLSMMPLHAWLQMQAMRAAQERTKAEDDYRRAMLGLQRRRLELEQQGKPVNPAYAVPIGGGRYGIPTSGGKYILLPPEFKPPTKDEGRPINPNDFLDLGGGKYGVLTTKGLVTFSLPPGAKPVMPRSTDPDTAARIAEAREKARIKAQQEMFSSMRVGQLKGKEVIAPDGKQWPLFDTIASASAHGALALTPKEADQYRAALSARDGIKTLIAMAHVLPDKPGMIAALGPLTRRIREITGDYRVTDFNTAKMALVQYARPLMGTLRVNKQEFAIGLGGITHATSFEAFNHGANLILDSLQRNIDLMQTEGSVALKPPNSASPVSGGAAPGTTTYEPAPPPGTVPLN
jgi:hypothetical protein